MTEESRGRSGAPEPDADLCHACGTDHNRQPESLSEAARLSLMGVRRLCYAWSKTPLDSQDDVRAAERAFYEGLVAIGWAYVGGDS